MPGSDGRPMGNWAWLGSSFCGSWVVTTTCSGGAVGVEGAHRGDWRFAHWASCSGIDRLRRHLTVVSSAGIWAWPAVSATTHSFQNAVGTVEAGSPICSTPAAKAGMDSSRRPVRSTQGGAGAQVANTSSMLASVEVEGGVQHPRLFIQVVAAAGGGGEVIQRAVAHRHPLGQAGRARVNIR